MTTISCPRHKATRLNSLQSVVRQYFTGKVSAKAAAFFLKNLHQSARTVASFMLLKGTYKTGDHVRFLGCWLITLSCHVAVIGTTAYTDDLTKKVDREYLGLFLNELVHGHQVSCGSPPGPKMTSAFFKMSCRATLAPFRLGEVGF